MEREGSPWRVAEFFAGAGLARLGLEATDRFRVSWANDLNGDKVALYRNQFGSGSADHMLLADIHHVHAHDLPGDGIDVAWASFPCTDLSLAGDRGGLAGVESGTWWAFHRILQELDQEGRKPPVVAVENVVGLATSDGGEDLRRLLVSLNDLGYRVDVLLIDARHFLPQSRPRLFIVAAEATDGIIESGEDHEVRPDWLLRRVAGMNVKTFRADLPGLPTDAIPLGQFVQRLRPTDARWWEPDRVERFVAELSEIQTDRLFAMRSGAQRRWRTAYRRTRHGRPAWEIREDEIAGCLRTVRGGSSKQAVVEAGRGQVRVRWMTPLEYARLMGAPDYSLRGFRPNQVYFGFGDAVAVPVVEWLARHLLDPLLA